VIKRLEISYRRLTRMVERLLAMFVLLGVGVSVAGGVQTLARLDWRTAGAFYGLAYLSSNRGSDGDVGGLCATRSRAG